MPRRLLLSLRFHGGRSRGGAAAGPIGAAALAVLIAVAPAPAVQAASPLLEMVKQNPAMAKKMCARFKQLNAEGQSATSPQAIAAVAAAQGLSPMDAEVLITYVIGLNCPDVR